jgi:hypothetical protein
MSKFFVRYTVSIDGLLLDDNAISAGNAQCAALSFWEQNTRNHPLPCSVTVIDETLRFQFSIVLLREVVAHPAGCKKLAEN